MTQEDLEDSEALKISVCSWSLQAPDVISLVERVHRCGVGAVQFGLTKLLQLDLEAQTAGIELLRASGLHICATQIGFDGEDYSSIAAIRRTGGFVPEETWEARRDKTIEAAAASARLGAELLSMHVGFIPTSNDPTYAAIVKRVAEVAQGIARHNVTLLIETGQETASELLQFINDLNCRNVGVNYDPANILLYGVGQPIEAIATLGRHIRHIHVKDAVASQLPGTQWGREVLLGQGGVDLPAMLDALDEIEFDGTFAMECELAGINRVEALRLAIRVLREVDQSRLDTQG